MVGDAARNLSVENIKDYSDFFDDMGPAQKVELLERKAEDNLRTYRYRVTFERQTQNLFVKLDQHDKIADFGLE